MPQEEVEIHFCALWLVKTFQRPTEKGEKVFEHPLYNPSIKDMFRSRAPVHTITVSMSCLGLCNGIL